MSAAAPDAALRVEIQRQAAGVTQAHQPIYRAAFGQGRPYKHLLHPLLQASDSGTHHDHARPRAYSTGLDRTRV
jgi:hypothetical protein